MTIGGALSGKNNALNFIRLVLACSVIVGHSYGLGGYGREPTIGGLSLGSVAVGGFFAISGYLIAGSRSRLRFVPFVWRRALRILPAFWVCLAVTAFVFAPISSALSRESWQPASAATYVLSNAFLYMRQFGIDNTLTTVPFAQAWNGSLWTLFYEFMAYLAAGVLVTVNMERRRATLVIASLLVLVTAAQPLAHGPLHISSNIFLQALWLGGFFLAGMLIWSVSDRLPRSIILAVGCIAGLVLAAVFGVFTEFAPLPLAYLLMWVGGTLPVRLFSTNDISYGVYIYAFPVQQILALLGMHRGSGVWVFSLVALGITAVLAWGSWKLVEQPALRLKYWHQPTKIRAGA